MSRKLAIELHPYYPEDWLNIASAQTRCALQSVSFRATLTWCKQQSLEVSSTGHIRALSLDQYIKRSLQEREDMYS